MKKNPCLYAIIRFCPLIETEEFANVGIIMLAPEQSFFDFKLMTKRHARVTGFFEQLDPKVFRNAMLNLKEELVRARTMLRQHEHDRRFSSTDIVLARSFFNEIVRPRESVVKFSKIRVVLAEDPKTKLEELYGHYVERDFITHEYREQVLEKIMRGWLVDAGLGTRFEKMEVGTDEYSATFPFVEQLGGRLRTAIKPLNLGQDQPRKIIDHGGTWVWRLSQLKRKSALPERVLVAVEGPEKDDSRSKAFNEIISDLRNTGATVIDYSDQEKILNYVSKSETIAI